MNPPSLKKRSWHKGRGHKRVGGSHTHPDATPQIKKKRGGVTKSKVILSSKEQAKIKQKHRANIKKDRDNAKWYELSNGGREREIKKLIRFGHDRNSAIKQLKTDYSNGYIWCKKCGAKWPMGNGFKKDIINDCIVCNPSKYEPTTYYGNPTHSSPGGIFQYHTGPQQYSAFPQPKKYWREPSGMSIIVDKYTIIKE